MKTHTYRVVWHDAGCIVFRSDGARLAMRVRLDQSEVNALGDKLAQHPGALWRRWCKN